MVSPIWRLAWLATHPSTKHRKQALQIYLVLKNHAGRSFAYPSSIRKQVTQHHHSLISTTLIGACTLWKHDCHEDELRIIPSHSKPLLQGYTLCKDVLGITLYTTEYPLGDKYSIYLPIKIVPRDPPGWSFQRDLFSILEIPKVLGWSLGEGQAYKNLSEMK